MYLGELKECGNRIPHLLCEPAVIFRDMFRRVSQLPPEI